jgi:hypothetical protein
MFICIICQNTANEKVVSMDDMWQEMKCDKPWQRIDCVTSCLCACKHAAWDTIDSSNSFRSPTSGNVGLRVLSSLLTVMVLRETALMKCSHAV